MGQGTISIINLEKCWSEDTSLRMGVGREAGGAKAPLDFESISKNRLFFQFRRVKNKFHCFWPPPGKNFGKILYWSSPEKNPSEAHA